MRFESLLDRRERGEITQAEAAEMLGVAGRMCRRWREGASLRPTIITIPLRAPSPE